MEYEKIEPDIWKPEKEGDEIAGVLVSIDDNVGQHGSKMYHLETEKGQTSVWGSAVLDDRMQYVKPGDNVKIVYKGTQENTKKQPTKIFEVFKAKSGKLVDETAIID